MTVIAQSDDGSPATPLVIAQSSPRGSGMPSQRTGTVQACATVVLPSSAQSWKSGYTSNRRGQNVFTIGSCAMNSGQIISGSVSRRSFSACVRMRSFTGAAARRPARRAPRGGR